MFDHINKTERKKPGRQDSIMYILLSSPQIRLDVNFQYFLKKEDLPILHRNYDLYYENVIRTSAIDALKVCRMTVHHGVADGSRTRFYIRTEVLANSHLLMAHMHALQCGMLCEFLFLRVLMQWAQVMRYSYFQSCCNCSNASACLLLVSLFVASTLNCSPSYSQFCPFFLLFLGGSCFCPLPPPHPPPSSHD